MNHLRSFAGAGVVALIAAGGVQSRAVAKPMEVALPPQAPQAKAKNKAPETRVISVRNVRADLMAWWLDPVRNVMPVEVMASYDAAKRSGETAPQSLMPEIQDDVYTDAKGLISFSSVRAQNSLIAYGSEEGISRFEEIVKSLDKPVTQIEISAQFVQMSLEDVAKLSIEFAAPKETLSHEANKSSKSSIGLARDGLQTQVDALIQQGKARVINAPHMTTLNNLTATTTSMSSSLAAIGIKDVSGQLKPVFDSTQDGMAARLHLGTMLGLRLTPSVQNDDVISLTIGPYKTLHVVVDTAKDMTPGGVANPYAVNSGAWINPYFTEQLQVKPGSIRVRKSENLFLKNLGGELSTLKVKSGETLVFTGLNTAAFSDTVPGKEGTLSTEASNMIILVTPKILRRAEAK